MVQSGSVLVVDGANVVGSVPDGWWKDRPGAARRLHERLLVADTPYDEISAPVLEGQAKGGVRAGRDGHVTTVHAPRDGDAEIRAQASRAVAAGRTVTVVTADRMLAAQVSPARALSSSRLLDRWGRPDPDAAVAPPRGRRHRVPCSWPELSVPRPIRCRGSAQPGSG